MTEIQVTDKILETVDGQEKDSKLMKSNGKENNATLQEMNYLHELVQDDDKNDVEEEGAKLNSNSESGKALGIGQQKRPSDEDLSVKEDDKDLSATDKFEEGIKASN